MKVVSSNVDLLENGRKFGVLYGDTHAEERARLIAAAPEMYELLCKVYAKLHRFSVERNMNNVDLYTMIIKSAELIDRIDGKEGNQ